MAEQVSPWGKWRNRLPLAAVVVGGVTMMGLLIFVPAESPGSGPPEWAQVVLVISVVLLAGGAVVHADTSKRRRMLSGDRAARIHDLTRSLEDALSMIAAIRAEVEEGEAALRDLQARSEYQQQVATLSEEQAAAVRVLLKDELSRSEKSSLRRDLVIAAASLILGSGITLWLQP